VAAWLFPKEKTQYVDAGWPNNWYWTGEANDTDNAYNVNLNDGNNNNGNNVNNHNPVACRR
jgi:hypothetical protein